MATIIRMKPSETERILRDALTAEERGGGIAISQVSVDIDRRTVEVMLVCDEPPLETQMLKIRESIASHLGPLDARVVIKWQPSVDTPLEVALSANGAQIFKSISQALPTLSGWLSAGKLLPRGAATVELILPSQLASMTASRRNYRDTIRDIVSDALHRHVMVRISHDDTLSPADPSANVDEPALEPAKAASPKQEIPVIIGRVVRADAVPIRSVVSPTKGVVFEGEAFGIEYRTTKQSGQVLVFNLTDRGESIACKAMVKGPCDLDEGMFVRVRGDVDIDKYTEELTVSVRDMVKASQALRQDAALEKRVELHLHTRMSSMDSVLDLEKAIAAASRWGMKAIAVTDHGVVQAFPAAHELSEHYRVKIVYGVEGYLIDAGAENRPPYHAVLIARDMEGLRQLYRLVTDSHLEHFYKKPRMLREEIAANRSHLLVGSACEAGELYSRVKEGCTQEELDRTAEFYDYLEMQPLGNNMFLTADGKTTVEDLMNHNRLIYQTGKRLGKPVVAASDVHFLEPDDAIYRTVLITAQGYTDSERESPLYLRTTQEMLDEFSYLGEEAAREVVIENTNLICDMTGEIKPVPSGFNPPDIPDAASSVEQVSRAEAKRLYGDPLPDFVRDRLDQELDAIVGGGFSGIYAIAQKLVARSMADGYLVGSRGSVGSSFVARLYGITEVNPLPPHYLCPECAYSDFSVGDQVESGFDLPEKSCPNCGHTLQRDGQRIAFEVFMGYKGDKVPDIDLNFSGENQGTVIKFTEELLGKGNVFRAGTITTVADRTAFGFVKAYAEATGKLLRKAEMARLARGVSGVRRTTGQHPGGVLILPAGRDILEFTPLQYPADDRKSGTVTTHFDYESISSRLLKLDILGHDDPTALKMLEKYTGKDPRAVPFSDMDTMSIFSSTDALGYRPEDIGCPVGAIGIPEFGTRFVRQMLADTRPKDFSGLVRISGLSHGTMVWLNNAQDLIKGGTASLSQVICARDDILNYLSSRGVRSDQAFRIMENVRKGKGITDEDEQLMRQHKVPEWYIDSCRKIRYLFPKAHAAAYVMMAFRIAYFKVHEPLAFYATYMSLRADDLDLESMVAGPRAMLHMIKEIEKKGLEATAKEKDQAVALEVAFEASLRGVSMLPVSLYESDARVFRIVGDKLLPPFAALSGMGKAAATNLCEARLAGEFTSIEDLRQRAHLQRNVIDILKRAGSLNGLPENNQMALF